MILFIPIIPIDEAYTTTETYYRSLRYKVISADVEYWVFSGDHSWEIVLQNVDVIGGSFKVTYKWKESWRPYTYSKWVTKNDMQYLMPGETGTFRYGFRVNESTNPAVAYKQYTITAARVADTKAVTKHETHYKSIIGVLTGWS